MPAPSFRESDHPRGQGGRFTEKPGAEPDLSLSSPNASIVEANRIAYLRRQEAREAARRAILADVDYAAAVIEDLDPEAVSVLCEQVNGGVRLLYTMRADGTFGTMLEGQAAYLLHLCGNFFEVAAALGERRFEHKLHVDDKPFRAVIRLRPPTCPTCTGNGSVSSGRGLPQILCSECNGDGTLS